MHRGLSPEPTYRRYLDVICVALPLPPVCADSYTLVFHEPMDACKFCLQVTAAAAVQGGRQGGRQARRRDPSGEGERRVGMARGKQEVNQEVEEARE